MILTIEGEGMLRRELTYGDLTALPRQVTHASSLFGGREVGAVLVSAVMRLVTPPGSARFITFWSADGYATTLPLAVADHALLVIRFGDVPLTQDRGGPVRLIVGAPDLRSCLKYVTEIVISAAGAANVLPTCEHPAHRAA